jgi:acyl-coenzyme A thioesterase PaaI-like protein
MKTKFFTLLSLSVLTLIVLMGVGSAVDLASWSLETDETATFVVANVVAENLTGGTDQSPVSNFDPNGAYEGGWDSTSINDTDYFQVTISPNTGYELTLSQLSFGAQGTTTTGPTNYQIKYSKNLDFSSSTNIGGEFTATLGSETVETETLSIDVAEGETLYVRWFAYNGSTGNFYLHDIDLDGTVELEDPDFCTWDDGWNLGGVSDNPGELKIKKIDVTNNGIVSPRFGFTRFGDDENWFLFEEIEVEITVQNKGDYDVDDIVIEWGLYNEDTEEWTIEVDEEDEEFNIRDGDTDSIIVTFKIDDDMDEDLEDLVDGNYRLYVRATGVIDDSDSPHDEEDTCVSDFAENSLVIEKDFVIVDNVRFIETASCGTDVQITADVWNIGSKNQEEVSVVVYNEALGIYEKIELGDIDSFEDKNIDVLIHIPEDAEEETYLVTLSVFDDNGDIFETDFDEDDSKFTFYMEVEGNCINEPKVTVSADLESQARAGRELVVRATIVNTGTETSTFEISLANYVNWAVLETVVPESITLEAGESEEVLITLDVNSDVSGNQNFEIVVTEGTNVLSQQVSVMIEQGGFGGLGRITGGLISESNWPIWTIGAVNVILVFIIILVALKISKK